MAFEPSLKHQIIQTLRFSPKLQQSVKILELSSAELGQHLLPFIEQNIFLNMEATEEFLSLSTIDNRKILEGLDRRINHAEKVDLYSKTHAPDFSLRDHLIHQIHTSFLDLAEMQIALIFVDTLDDSGYLPISNQIFAQKLGCSEEIITKVRNKFMSLDPVGIGAPNLKSCLRSQLQDSGKTNPHLDIILDHLEVIAQGKTHQLQNTLKISAEQIHSYLEVIRKLNPRPACAYGSVTINQRIPDVYVFQDESGNFFAKFNSDALPKVWIDEGYFENLLKQTTLSSEIKFIKTQFSYANNLVKMLENRIHTILRVTGAILEHQKNFFKNGIQFIKPLNLKTIATELNIHESTVSRAIHEKHMMTPRGLFSFQYFFSTNLKSSIQFIDHSSTFIKHRIKKLIEQENKRKPLSDEKIVKVLHQEQIIIARRTVNKYREMMKIPPASHRKIA